ncbi:DNA modification methylase [Glaciibacter psychrotolerans]|uniref:DNA modification methylase n=1 Tax=Glaciibacter psychrotolerans TaxID=670054 RepID=A0A7Z0J7W3_9MICO|nr:DNA modification methylase [Leifsonia psychrotolerans]NYJ21711.1 hypothetical protein [Leifsonia psychrotolerans]
MRARIVASVVVAAGILLGTSGCNLFAPQATTNIYDASDGVSGNVGDLAIRNAVLISDNGELGNLLVTVVNSGKTEQTLTVQFSAGGKKVTQQVDVPANSTTSFGDTGQPGIVLEGFDAIPGALLPLFFQYGEQTGIELLVPVLTTSLPEYSSFSPTPSPKPTADIIPIEPNGAPLPTGNPIPTETTAP